MALREITGLWLGEKGFLRGKSEDGRVYLVFKNDKNGSERAPDYRLYEKVETEEFIPTPPSENPEDTWNPPEETAVSDEELPF